MINAIIKNTDIDVETSPDERLISSTIGIYKINFNFDQSWRDFGTKKAVFKINQYREEKIIDNNNICLIPENVMKEFGELKIGVYAENAVARKSTVWSNSLEIEKGSKTDDVYYFKEEI